MEKMMRKELEELGVDVDKGIKAHMGNEAMYVRILKIVIMDEKFEEMFEYADSPEAAPVFELSHSLKGTVGNVGLSEIDKLITDICETTRHGGLDDVAAKIATVKRLREQILFVIA